MVKLSSVVAVWLFGAAAAVAVAALPLYAFADGTEANATLRPTRKPVAFLAFRRAVMANDKHEVARHAHFPFSDPRWPEPLSKAEFLREYDRIFSYGVRRQVEHGVVRRVNQRDVAEAARDELDSCGAAGDLLLELPTSFEVDYANDDEAFLRLVFRRIAGALVLWRVIGCS